MKKNKSAATEKREETRESIEEFYSVQFSMHNPTIVYHFKIRDKSDSGLSILVKEDSKLLGHLHVGRCVRMKYYREEPIAFPKTISTQIVHITREKRAKYSGHFLVGLSIDNDNCKQH